MDEVIYTLKDTFEYAHTGSGNLENAQFITLLPPTARYITDIAPLKSSLFKAIQWAQDKEDNDSVGEGTGSGGDVETISAKAMMTTLDLTPDVDMAKVMLHINSMLTNGLAKVDGEMRFTKPISEKISIIDVYGLAGTFLVNFIIPSL